MELTIAWYKCQSDKNSINGICKHLPDLFCHFTIIRRAPDRFWVMLPSLTLSNFDKQIIVRDAQTARQLCQDFLNYNLKAIISHQIYEMKRRSIKGERTVSYYEDLLSRIAKVEPPKTRFSKRA